MNARTTHGRDPRRVLALGALGGAFVAAWLGFGVDTAHAAYKARVDGDTLRITGDAASDKLALRLQPGAPTVLQVDVGEDGTADFSFDRTTFTAIDVEAAGGDDEVRVDQSGGTFTDEAVTLNGGGGNDTLIGASGAETFVGGSGDDFVDGNQGADTASLGGGNDHFQWDPGDGSDVVDGQGGAEDALDFNGSNAGEKVDVSANGPRVLFTRNIASIVMDLDGMERLNFRALGGVDNVTVGELGGTDVKSVDVDLDGFGGVGDESADTVTALGTDGADAVKFTSADGRQIVSGLGALTRVTGGEEALDSVGAAGLGGADSFAMTVGTPGAIPFFADGGEDADEVRYTGTNDADTIGIARNGTRAAVFAPGTALLNVTAEHILVQGLGGADTIAGQNGIGTITSLTLDGGSDGDTVRGGDGADELIGGSGDDLVDGNIGADQADLGPGNDHFQWDPGDGSDVVEGQGGDDALDFNGSNAAENIDVSANGPRGRLTRNIASIVMDFDGIEHVNVRALGSADNVTVGQLGGTDIDSVDVDLNGFDGNGDAAADTVTALGTDNADNVTFGTSDGRQAVLGLGAVTRVTGGEEALDSVGAAGLGGADSFAMSVGVPGAIPFVADGGDDADEVRYSGTADADTIGIARNGAFAAVFAPGTALLNVAVEHTLVQGLAGADTIAGQNGIGTITSLTLDGGSDGDTIRGGDGADELIGGSGDDLVDGNIGADHADLGSGNDHFQWDPGDGSDVVEGQSGDDTLDFNGSNAGEKIAVQANGPRVLLTRDIASITMDFDAIEHVNVRALGSADTITVGDVGGTDVKSVDVDLNGFGGVGDGAADTVVVQGTSRRDVVGVTRDGGRVVVDGLAAVTTIVGSEPALDTLRVETLAGDDDVTVAPDVGDLIAPVVDLGTDE